MIPVKSSNIEAVAHDGKHLTVKFKSGTTWSYHDVPAHVYCELLAAESVGGYFAKNIRNAYEGTKHE